VHRALAQLKVDTTAFTPPVCPQFDLLQVPPRPPLGMSVAGRKVFTVFHYYIPTQDLTAESADRPRVSEYAGFGGFLTGHHGIPRIPWECAFMRNPSRIPHLEGFHLQN